MLKVSALILIVFCSVLLAGPYASTAIYRTDLRIIEWATSAVIERGFVDISEPELGCVDYGSDVNCLGPAEGEIKGVVSLGDGGMATLGFQHQIVDGNGFDFVVFENSYSNTFLELAFVEVSSDGQNFFRFNAVSLTDPNKQVGTFGSVDATNINNLAGKYGVGWGTPFDLHELAGIEGLDVNSITHIRIIDVVGCIQSADFNNDGSVNFVDYSLFASAYLSSSGQPRWNKKCDIALPANIINAADLAEFMSQWLAEWSSFDSLGNKINDPWPTPFFTGGFDLDAVGVIHRKLP